MLSAKGQKKVTAQKPLHPLIISDFTPFHEPKNRRPNISLTKITENPQKVGQKAVVIEKVRRGGHRPVRRPRTRPKRHATFDVTAPAVLMLE